MKPLPFQHAKLGGFFQAPPSLYNTYTGDAFLRRLLQRILPPAVFQEVDTDLTRLGDRVRNEIEELGYQCEVNEPVLHQFDPWGKRVDNLVTCTAWRRMKEITAEEEIVASGYSGRFGEFGRIFQFAKCLIFHPSSGLYSCPIAMTDGAAKTLRELKLPQFDSVLKRLITNDPTQFWSSGQWMTERGGGSDVADGTETLAIPQPDGTFRLHGYKWFSSATDADVALTLARIVDDKGNVGDGSSGLSMFFLKTRQDDGALNGIQMMKLKNKLGTRSLPTAELLLDGTVAELVSEPGRGVAAISHMLTVTRLHNTVGSVSAMRRVLLLARDYSLKRSAFGVLISEHALHIDTLAEMELMTRAGTLLLFEVVRLLGLTEHGKGATEEERHVLRLLTPVAKLYVAKKCMGVVSEGLECFGGQGYIEDTGLPCILRNAQVTPIWEGTTNVLSLDTLRAVAKSGGAAISAFHTNMTRRLKAQGGVNNELTPAIQRVTSELEDLVKILPQLEPTEAMARARIISFAIAEISIGMLFIEHATSKLATKTDLASAIRWSKQLPKFALQSKDTERFQTTHSFGMVFDGSQKSDLKAKL